MQQTLFLASTSPRRFELLSSLDIPFDVLHINVPEIKSPNELPETYVQRLSRDKAIAGIEMTIGERIVIGADTIGVLDDLVLEKPRDECDAILMLKQLSGRTHTVLTGLTVATETKSITDVIKAEVTFRKLSDEEIIKYVATKESLDKAGSYGIQGRGGAFVKSINGNYQAIIGLPLAHLIEMLSDIK